MKLRFIVVFVFAILLAGCGGGNSASVGTSGGVTNSASSAVASPNTGTVILQFSDAPVSAKVNAWRVTGADGTGAVLFGPAVFAAAPSIEVSGVPVGVTSLLVHPLVGTQPVDAVASVVKIDPQVPLVLKDPLSNFLRVTSIVILPTDPPPIAIGGSLSLRALCFFGPRISFDLTDTVTWSAVPATLASITSTGACTGSAAGTGTVNAALQGVSGSAPLTVQSLATTTTLTTSASTLNSGDSVTFSATVTASSGGVPAGQVSFLDGTTVLAPNVALDGTGKASFTTATLSRGTHSITAVYGGSSTLAGSTSQALTETVTGNIFVAGGNSVSRVTLSGARSLYAFEFPSPTGIAFDSVNRVYVSNFSNGSVLRVPPGPPGQEVVSPFGGSFAGPAQMAFGADGFLYVAEQNAGKVSKVSPIGVKSDVQGNLVAPYGLAFDSKGNLYVSQGAPASNIVVISTSGAANIFAANIPQAAGIAVDKLGAVYVAQGQGQNKVTRIQPDGSNALPFAAGFGGQPVGLCFDDNGNLYVSDAQSNNLYQVTPDGAVSVLTTIQLGPPMQIIFR